MGSYVCVDVESDSDSPSTGSIVCFGAVLVSDTSKTFYGQIRPISNNWNADALAISGFNRDEHLKFEEPYIVMKRFADWLEEVSEGRPTFISDNPAFDFKWVDFYFHKYLGKNPFGFSARRIGDLYCGLVKNASKNPEWKKKYRITEHTHHPIDDAKGNCEALIAFRDKLGLNIKF